MSEMDLTDKVAAAIMSAQAHSKNLGGQADAAIEIMRDEIERLTERCAAYKGQVECGANEIERMRSALEKIAACFDEVGELAESAPDQLSTALEAIDAVLGTSIQQTTGMGHKK